VDRTIAIVPARDAADELAGALVQLFLQARGIPSELLSSKVLFGEMVESLQQSQSNVVLISAVPPFAVRHTRLFCKRLKARAPETMIVAGVWSEQADDHRVDQRLRTAGADKVVGTLAQAVDFLERRRPVLSNDPAPSTPPKDPRTNDTVANDSAANEVAASNAAADLVDAAAPVKQAG
jgi:hypothetical protein